jgi:CubicO group peptidase (beta-lactamase class C family)
MPRSLQDILDHADEIADRLERGDYEPNPHDARGTRLIVDAIERRAQAERDIVEGVTLARADGLDWRTIGVFLGTTGEAARQRYGPAVARTRGDAASLTKATPSSPERAASTKARGRATKNAR